ncbi:hypothetical protein D3C84_696510 [compost metagenome]
MHMRAGRTTRRPDLADHAAPGKLLPHLHIDLRHMAEHADEALAVVDEHGVAVEEVIADENHLACGRRLDGCPSAHCEIQA